MPDKETTPAGLPVLRPIGAVAAETGIDPSTLRAWERRYKFPAPARRESRQRLYTEEEVARLHLIALALRSGYRAGQVVGKSKDELDRILKPTAKKGGAAADPSVAELERCLLDLDWEGLRLELSIKLMAVGPRAFVMNVVAPFADRIGDAWARHEIGIHQEHVATHVMRGLLMQVLAQRPEGKAAPRIVLTTLPGEMHSLGLKMAAVISHLAGGAPRLLGPETPLPEIVAAARAVRARVVGISVAAPTASAATSQRLKALRGLLPSSCQLWIGGKGAIRLRGIPKSIRRFRELDELEKAVKRLAEGTH